MVRVAEAALVIVPTLQIIGVLEAPLAPLVKPCVNVVWLVTSMKFAGSTLVATTFVAVEGPLLVTTMVLVTFPPLSTEFVLLAMVTPKSALVRPTNKMLVCTLLELGSGWLAVATALLVM